MSYNPMEKQDYISEMFSRASDFNQCKNHLMRSKDDMDSFVLWLDKLASIDQRQLRIFVSERYEEFDDKIKACVKPYIISKQPIEAFLEG